MELNQLEQAIAHIEALPDPVAREQARRLVAEVLHFHRQALQRLCGQLSSESLAQLSQDELISNLLSLHDLHPDPLEVRVERALERVRPQLSGPLLLLECGPEILLSLRLDGCASTQAQARMLVENALLEFAPDAGPIRYQEPLVQLQMRLR